jgi:hypothetical protein
MDTIYSGTLLIALLAAVVTIAIPATVLFRGPLLPTVNAKPIASRSAILRVRNVWKVAALICVISALTSLVIHFFFGHAAGSDQELAAWDFAEAHSAYIAVGILLILGFGLFRLAFPSPEDPNNAGA